MVAQIGFIKNHIFFKLKNTVLIDGYVSLTLIPAVK